jgi:hypothetical protein
VDLGPTSKSDAGEGVMVDGAVSSDGGSSGVDAQGGVDAQAGADAQVGDDAQVGADARGGGDASSSDGGLLGADAASPDDVLARIRAGMVGHWHGTVTTPWAPVYEVNVEFDMDGHYSAHCADAACNVAFYYGVDDDSPLKTYEVFDAYANGEGRGRIWIYFGNGSSYTNIDGLDHIALSTDLSSLRFEFWHQLTYGPLIFELARTQ